MPTDLVYPEDIDSLLNWSPGRASRLARARKLPHYVLPDDSIRFRIAEIEPLILRVLPSTVTTPTAVASAN